MSASLRSLLAAVAMLALAGPAAADYWSDFEAAIDAYAEGDYGAARETFESLARAGDNRAQYWLGIMYFEGKGVPRDNRRAYLWLSLSAEQGNRAARAGRSGVARRMSADDLAAARRLLAQSRPAE